MEISREYLSDQIKTSEVEKEKALEAVGFAKGCISLSKFLLEKLDTEDAPEEE